MRREGETSAAGTARRTRTRPTSNGPSSCLRFAGRTRCGWLPLVYAGRVERNILSGGYDAVVRGETSDRQWNYICDVITRTPERVILRTRTEPETHLIELTPRFVGDKMGKPSGRAHGTFCNMTLDGQPAAFAEYYEHQGGILVIPEEMGG